MNVHYTVDNLPLHAGWLPFVEALAMSLQHVLCTVYY